MVDRFLDHNFIVLFHHFRDLVDCGTLGAFDEVADASGVQYFGMATKAPQEGVGWHALVDATTGSTPEGVSSCLNGLHIPTHVAGH